MTIKYSDSFGKKYKCKDGIHSLRSTSKSWQEAIEHRRIISLDDNSVTREKNLVIVDMSSWDGKPSAADWTNYVRVYRKGLYNATYNFESETIGGATITDWTKDEGGGTVDIINDIGGHYKVMELHDTNAADAVHVYQTITGQGTGILEFFIRTSDVTLYTDCLLYEGATILVQFYIDSGYFNLYYGGAGHSLGKAFNNRWYHIKIDFDCSTDTMDCYIDNNLVASGVAFQNNGTEVNKVFFGTGSGDSNYYSYIDAIGYDWESYSEGDNLTTEEGGEVEINSQPIDSSWTGGNHDSVAFLVNNSSENDIYIIYYGETSLGAPSYTSDLTVTADSPNAGDYLIVQDSYYEFEIHENAANANQGGVLGVVATRVSGGRVELSSSDLFSLPNTNITISGTAYQQVNEQDAVITIVEGSTGANAGAVLVAFEVTGYLEDGANNHYDGGSGDATYRVVYIFCDCQLVKVEAYMIFPDAFTSNYATPLGGRNRIVDGYFSHISRKYGSTHAVVTMQDWDAAGVWSTHKYSCAFDTTSNDGIAIHKEESNLPSYGDTINFDEGAGYDYFMWWSDNTGGAYSAQTYYHKFWIQIDDFTEADGANDDDGDQPAHRKNDELLTSLDQTNYSEVSF